MKIFDSEMDKLDEVYFQAKPSKLKELANFLIEMADELENVPEKFGHAHAKDHCVNWSEQDPEVIIFKPNT